MKTLKKYLKIWWLLSRNSFIAVFNARVAFVIFFTGKVLRFVFFFAFLYFLIKGANSLAGYNINQAIFFFLTFNVIDVISQFLFREVYRFRPQIISGSFDLSLVKPVNILFKSLMGGADVIDLITIPPLIFAVIWVGNIINPNIYLVILYILLVINGMILATAFHISVLALGILTLEIDHAIMIYRDITNLGRLPIDIYKEPLRGVLTFLIPVGVMVTLPAKALMGFVSPQGVLGSFALSVILIFVSIKFWNYALKFYTSASS